MNALKWRALFVALIASGCTDVAETSYSTFLVRGKAATGAHARTALPGGYVGFLRPGPSGWTKVGFAVDSEIPNKAVTNSDGSFTFKIDIRDLEGAASYPIFIAVSDSAQTFTMIAQIPKDLAHVDAELLMDINPTTTAAGQLICPGGKYPPPSGAYCYSDPNQPVSTVNTSLVDVIDAFLAGALSSLQTGSPPNWQTFMRALLANAEAWSQLQAIATNIGLTSSGFTASAITSSVGTATLPLITQPIPGIDDNTPDSDTDSDSAGSCSAVWTCGSSPQCATIMGGSSGTKSGFEDSSACEAWCKKYIPGGCTCSGC